MSSVKISKKSPIARFEEGLSLDCGKRLSHLDIAYQTYGHLNARKNNAVLVCHGLTLDQYAAGTHPMTGKAGWWNHMIGSGKPLDSDHYFHHLP